MSPFVNSVYTLFVRRNYMKLYQKSYFKAIFQSEIMNGLRLTTGFEYSKRKFLSNSTDYSFTGDENRSFTPNDPDHVLLMSTQFADHSAFIFDFNLRIRVKEKYMMRPDRKINLGSKYPTLNIFYTSAIPDILRTSIRFDRIGVSISESRSLGLAGNSSFLFEISTLASRDSISFIDYQHFQGNRTVVGNFNLGNFQLLDYYFYSTLDRYFKAHFEHHFNGFIFNKMPGIRQFKTQAVFTINYLNTKEVGSYLELGFGIEHIFKIFRVDFFMSLNERGNNRQGVVFGFGF